MVFSSLFQSSVSDTLSLKFHKRNQLRFSDIASTFFHTLKSNLACYFPSSVMAVPWTWPMDQAWRALLSLTSRLSMVAQICGETTQARRKGVRLRKPRKIKTGSSLPAACLQQSWLLLFRVSFLCLSLLLPK